MTNNTKPMARVPIVPSDYANKEDHKLHELVMDYTNNDIYVKDADGYVNLTGKIKQTIQAAIDNGAVIELVTKDTIPTVENRKKNHWYLIITDAEVNDENGKGVVVDTYIYYGLVDANYNAARNYSLLSQNMISSRTDEPIAIKMLVTEGFKPCFYVPSNTKITCVYNDGHSTKLEYNIVDNIYTFSPQDGTYTAYNVVMFDNIETTAINGKNYLNLLVTASGSNTNDISFETVNDTVGFKPILPIAVETNTHIAQLPQPEWEDKRYSFKGWSLKRSVYDPIDIAEYTVTKPITLYAWFDYNAQGNRVTVNVVSTTG